MEATVKPEKKRSALLDRLKGQTLFQFKSLRTKILVGFGAVIVLVIGMAIGSYYSTNRMTTEMSEMIETEIPLMMANERTAYSVARRSTNVRAYMMTGSETYRSMFENTTEDTTPYLETLQRLGGPEIDTFIEEHNAWTDGMITEVFDVYAAGDEMAADANLHQISANTTTLLNGLSESALESEAIIEQAGEDLIATGESSLRIILILAISVIVVAVFIALVTAQSISRPINKVVEKLTAISQGNLLSEPLTAKEKDETGKLAQASNIMQDRLKEIIQNISAVSEALSMNSTELSESAHEVMSGTDQVAVTMQELAEGAETQATSASDLATLMDSFSQKVLFTSKNGDQINRLSTQVLEQSTQGSELMTDSEKQMKKIDQLVLDSVNKVNRLDEETQEISKLVSIIQEIANQTNLLALNAAIEAARAGEEGKGFAVVAEEVRKLAEQVEVSVGDITGFVENIQVESKNVSHALLEGYKEVEEGTSKIQKTGETFNQITKTLDKMAKNISTINTNLSQVEESTDQMNQSIEEIASTSQESAAGVEETSAATEQINSSMEEVAGNGGKVTQLVLLSEDMKRVVSEFQIEE